MAIKALPRGNGFEIVSADGARWLGYVFAYQGRFYFESPSVRCNRNGYATVYEAAKSIACRTP